jgi:hypothetical protein
LCQTPIQKQTLGASRLKPAKKNCSGRFRV